MSERRDSAIRRWHDAGGNLTRTRLDREACLDLYPFIQADVDRELNYTALVYVVLLIAALSFIGYFSYTIGTRDPLADQGRRLAGITLTATATTADLVAAGPAQVVTLSERDYSVLSSNLGAQRAATLPPLFTQIPTFTRTPTASATVTPSSTPTITPTPSATPFPGCSSCEPLPVAVRLGWFYPPLAGAHCPAMAGHSPAGLEDCTDLPLADGEDWWLRVGEVAACPVQWPLGSYLTVAGLGSWLCAHRLDVAQCDAMTRVCDVLVLSDAPLVADWSRGRPGLLWLR